MDQHSSAGRFQLIPVLDVAHGLVVRAYRGYRESYRPWVDSVWGCHAEPCWWLQRLDAENRFTHIYVADLDALEGGARQWDVLRHVACSRLRLWYEGALHDVQEVREVAHCLEQLALVEWHLVIGLETWQSPKELRHIGDYVSAERIVFSLDVRKGQPMANAAWDGDLGRIAEQVWECGVRRMILLDLDQVGTGCGNWSSPLVRRLLATNPDWKLFPGGGIRSEEDLIELDRLGCAGALVGTALHTGRI
ncbi:MAG: phosphoribosylformimino-5-aminoimidazole carboxamide ribotide isomerase [Pirellulaceae bacterium]|nr:MAG: phosphoribosylformimino-5-aminoimidazole carboxamide ribotide isomerase [Pirellulaceae bacterium]